MGRKRAFGWRWRILALVLLVVLVAGGWAWWQAQHRTPSRADYPVQGVLVGAEDGAVDFNALKAIGADFAYVEASDGARARDPAFARNLRMAQASGIPFGAVHAYDPCEPAQRQSTNFVTIVPRDAALLPPVIELDRPAEDCADATAEAAVESELTTFLNQIEGHVGLPAVLKVSPRFEERYGIAARIDRNLWLARDWFQPDYAGRPWTLWTANSRLINQAGDPVRWVVVQP